MLRRTSHRRLKVAGLQKVEAPGAPLLHWILGVQLHWHKKVRDAGGEPPGKLVIDFNPPTAKAKPPLHLRVALWCLRVLGVAALFYLLERLKWLFVHLKL